MGERSIRTPIEGSRARRIVDKSHDWNVHVTRATRVNGNGSLTVFETPPSVSTDVLTDPEQFNALGAHWNDLVESSEAPNIFLTWEWLATWREVIAPHDPVRVLVVRDSASGEPVGLAPFVIRRQPASGPTLWRELVFMGAALAAPDHLDCIARRGREEEVASAVRDWLSLRDPDRGWDVIRLDGASPASRMVRGLLADWWPGATAMWEIPCPYIPLRPTWDEYADALSTKFYRNLRRRLRKLKRESTGRVSFETVRAASGVDGGLEDLFRLHADARRAHGERSAFEAPVKRRFYRQVLRRFAERGWLRLHLLKVQERAAAASLCFHYGGKAWSYQLGYASDLSQYGPGYIITRHMIECAIEEGATEMDMLRGDHEYKYEWNAQRRSILKLRLASSVAGGMVAPATRWLRAAKRGWKTWRRTH